jgi:hypothetical protein
MSEEKNTTANRPVSASPAGFENVIGCFRKMLYATNETQVGPRPEDLDARSCISRVSRFLRVDRPTLSSLAI